MTRRRASINRSSTGGKAYSSPAARPWRASQTSRKPWRTGTARSAAAGRPRRTAMLSTDRAEFGELLTQVLAFYKQDASKFVMDLWWGACKPFELEQVRRALSDHAMHPEKGQFCPRPADLVRERAGTFTDRSLMAWR